MSEFVGNNGRTTLRLTSDPTIANGRVGDSAVVVDGEGRLLRAYGPKMPGGWPPPVSVSGFEVGRINIGRTITTDDAIDIDDFGTAMIFDSAVDRTIVLPDDVEQGFWCTMICAGVGLPIFEGGGDAILVHPYGHDRIGMQFGSVTLMTWLSAMEWSLLGETAGA